MVSSIKDVKKIILVLSGKGGVGKSTLSTQLALRLSELGFRVGLLDVDLCGPSVPHLLNVEDSSVHQSSEGWVPVYSDDSQKLAIMSVAFLLKSKNDSIVWRGPKKTELIKQFIRDVYWDERDFLIVDTPPGTSDEHITIMTELRDSHAIIITTPQMLSVDDVSKEISLCKTIGIDILGLVENMSGFVCPSCKECTKIWSSGGGKELAHSMDIQFLGEVPVIPAKTFSNHMENVVTAVTKLLS